MEIDFCGISCKEGVYVGGRSILQLNTGTYIMDCTSDVYCTVDGNDITSCSVRFRKVDPETVRIWTPDDQEDMPDYLLKPYKSRWRSECNKMVITKKRGKWL